MSTNRTDRLAVALGALALIATALAACDDGVRLPTTPEWDLPNSGSAQGLAIHATLTAEQGACLEATILYDGRELAAARTRCSHPRGCGVLRMEARTVSSAGQHTLSLLVLNQEPEEVTYVAQADLSIVQEGSVEQGADISVPTGPGWIALSPIRATLRAGESVTFDVDLLE